MSFVKTKLPCPQCGGSDPVGLNEDGSAYCFSCSERIPNYYKAVSGGSDSYKAPPSMQSSPVVEMQTYRNNAAITSDGEFNALTDRKISLETAKKYAVKSSLNTKSEIVSHSYPYYNINEVAGYKIRNTTDKLFTWTGSSKELL
jgi:hypothetical protein